MTAPPVELAFQRKDEANDLDGLLGFLLQEEQRSEDDGLNGERAVALDFYNGEPFGDEEDGRSQVVTRDVAEVIDYATVSLVRTMISGDNAVEFECSDKDMAEEITAAVGQEFYQGQDGYRVLHDWIKAGLMEKSSICKACVEEQPDVRREDEMPVEMIVMLQEEGKRILAASPIDPEETMWRVAWAEPQPPLFPDYVVPNEESAFSFDARDLDKGCAYVGFRMPKSISDLVAMGYEVDNLSDDTYENADGILASARDGYDRTAMWAAGSDRTGPNRVVWLREEYARYDMNGDGITELVKVHRVGDTILHAEPIDEQPGVAWCPFPMPSRIIGQSLADKVMDIQRTRSVLMRQALDNIYQSNSPRWTISESSIGDTTIDDMLTVRAGNIIRHVGAAAPGAVAIPFTADSSFGFMEVLAGEKESRTGITRLNQGLDADALNKTASGTAMMQATGQQIEDYMARNFVEAFARLMLKKYRLMRAHGRPMTVMINGEQRETDPRQWPESVKTRVRVGLGTGRKTERLAARMNLLSITQASEAAGVGLFSKDNLYNQIAGVIEDSSLGPVNRYIQDPAKMPPEDPKPDPEQMKMQSDAMIEAAKVEEAKRKAQADEAMKGQQLQVEAALEQQRLDYELQAKRERAALEMQLAEQKADFEARLADQQAARQWQLSVMQLAQQKEIAAMQAASQSDVEPTMKKYRPGGDLDK